MTSDNEIYKNITELSSETSAHGRAETNLLRFIEIVSERERFLPYLKEIAGLFAVSQFLANFCISNPDELLKALKEIKEPVTKKFLLRKRSEEILPFKSPPIWGDLKVGTGEGSGITDIMKEIRLFKKRYLLRITLRYITDETDILSSMDELTSLAEVIIDFALQYSLQITLQKFGDPSNEALSLIALGKLGGEELNYSSDVDLMAVYATEEGQTSGVLGPTGVRMNRINNNEFYFKVIELFNKILSRNTEDGVAYRVDLRLRPQGNKGELALPLNAYRTYYETWGRTWERMALIRARHVAGNAYLGEEFMGMIEPFVWGKTTDYSEIEEIRALKKKIDSAFSRNDIKRGYGGIREIEFFIHTFQLIYGHDHIGLRTHRLLNAIQSLRWLGMIPEDDLITLWDNYLYLRQLEHLLQMKDDLQTHLLPTSENDLKALAIKTGFSTTNKFLSGLRLRRMRIKNIYNSLLGTEEDIYAEALTLLEGDISDDELIGYLTFRGLKSPETSIENLKSMREQFGMLRTHRERTAMRRVIPELIEKALNSEDADRALRGLNSFLATIGVKETYLTGIIERKELKDGIIKVFALSNYLTRTFLSNPRYLDLLIEEKLIRKPSKMTLQEIKKSIRQDENFQVNIVEHKRFEELRAGLLFLMKIMPAPDLFRYLSHLANSLIGIIAERVNIGRGFSVIGLGKLGGREITFGSDLDIIFLSEVPDGISKAEYIIKTLTTYTERGMLYNVDLRLRPDGSKGVLVKDMEGYRNYYLRSAHPWEIQAVIKAGHVAGDKRLSGLFMEMAGDVILKRGKELKIEDVKAMRQRIVKELSHESTGIDIKLGPGGMEEIEFYIQWLQIHHELLIRDTNSAIRHLTKKGILNSRDGRTLLKDYNYLRTLETLMRLNEEQVIVEDSEFTSLTGIFMGHKSKDEFIEYLNALRERVKRICF